MKLTLLSSDGGVPAGLRCEGEITATMAGNNPMGAVLGPGGFEKKVLLDLDRAASINSTGVAWLVSVIRTSRRPRPHGGVSIPPTIDHVLRLLSMPSLFTHCQGPGRSSLSS